MSSPSKLTLSVLSNAVGGGAVAIRAVTRLVPAGGEADKVFPPTYTKEKQSQTKYAMEERHIDGRSVLTVLLDSVASQANRMEEALLEGWRRGELRFPIISVDFRSAEGLADLEEITSLQAPHRVADAILRDSKDGNLKINPNSTHTPYVDPQRNAALVREREQRLGLHDSAGLAAGYAISRAIKAGTYPG